MPLPSVLTSRSRPLRSLARMLREVRENPERTRETALIESPEIRRKKRRRKSLLLRKPPRRRKLPRLMLPSVRAEDVEAAKDNSDVILNLSKHP